jgi:hypothetical protein
VAVFLFFDESGDLNFSPKGTPYFYFGVLTTRNPAALAQPLSVLRYELLADGVEIKYFHAAEDRQQVRDRVFEIISQVGGFEFDCIVVEKAKANPALHDVARFYPQFAGYLLRYIFRRYPDPQERIVVITDRIPIEAKRKAIEKAFKTFISKNLGERPYTLVHDASPGHSCLQAADYCTWAVHRKWRNGDRRSYDIVQRFVISELEIFRNGKERYY